MEKPDLHYDENPGGPARAHSAGVRAVAWVLAVFAAIALFLGLFILFAGENQSVGIGGDLSWRVDEINSAWAYGLLVGGAALLLGGLVTLWRRRRS
jgi:ABC-type Fe3+ transport system permease subunit